MANLARSTMLLTMAAGIEFGLQFTIPMIFVRHLDPATFGEYRLLWLMASTALGLAPAFMPQALFYFVPRASGVQKRVYIGNALAYLAAAGVVVGVVASPLNPLAPGAAATLFRDTGGISAVFLGCWMVTSLMTALPISEGRMRWQAGSDMSMALFRTLLLASAAIFMHDIAWVVAALMVEATARLLGLTAYLLTRPEGGALSFSLPTLLTQLRYSIPFALGNGLYNLRLQSDQWVAASMLPPALFGMFSIGAVFLPVASLIRQPVNNALMPHMNKAFAAGDYAEILRLFRKSSAAASLMLIPLAGGLYCAAPELAQIVYTGKYVAAVPVMRLYLIGMMMYGCAAGHLLPALNKGGVAVLNNACCLALSVSCSYFGAHHWGMVGAALGSVLSFGIGEAWSLRVIAGALGVSTTSLLPWRALGTAGLGTALAMAAVGLFEEAAHEPAFLMLFAKGVVYLLVFASVFFAAGGKEHLELFGGLRGLARGAGRKRDTLAAAPEA
jgi:O-antigen/teichoic acid export membrane protein